MFRDQAKFRVERKPLPVLVLSVLVCLMACSKPELPNGILTEKQMVNTLMELYITEEKVASLALPYDSVRKVFPVFSDNVFLKAGIPDSVFRKSMDYYMEYPDQLERIYTAAVDSLNLRIQKMSVEKKEDVVS
jgi:hypothetical protein